MFILFSHIFSIIVFVSNIMNLERININLVTFVSYFSLMEAGLNIEPMLTTIFEYIVQCVPKSFLSVPLLLNPVVVPVCSYIIP